MCYGALGVSKTKTQNIKIRENNQESHYFSFVGKQKGNGDAHGFVPSSLYPARQFLESVDESGPAAIAGLQPGDYLVNVNNQDVRTWGHDDLVKLIRKQQVMSLHVIQVTKHKTPIAAAAEPKRTPGQNRNQSRIEGVNDKGK